MTSKAFNKIMKKIIAFDYIAIGIGVIAVLLFLSIYFYS
jgi:hypothetical protein